MRHYLERLSKLVDLGIFISQFKYMVVVASNTHTSNLTKPDKQDINRSNLSFCDEMIVLHF